MGVSAEAEPGFSESEEDPPHPVTAIRIARPKRCVSGLFKDIRGNLQLRAMFALWAMKAQGIGIIPTRESFGVKCRAEVTLP